MAYDLAWLTQHLHDVTGHKLTKAKVEALLKQLGFNPVFEVHGEIDRRVKLLVAHLREHGTSAVPTEEEPSLYEDELFENETPVDTSPEAEQPSTEDPVQ